MRIGRRKSFTIRHFVDFTVDLVVSMIKSRRFRWIGQIARIEKKGRGAFKILTGRTIGKRILGAEVRTILQRILKKQLLIRRVALIQFKIRIIGGPLLMQH